MTNVLAIHSVGESLRAHLDAAYPDELRERFPCEFRLLATGEVGTAAPTLDGAVTLLLYRVTANEHVRNASRLDAAGRENVPLSLDLHFLLTAWAGTALAEHTLLAWAARQLQQRPVLDAASLTGDAAWGATDVVHLVPAELSVEDMMRVWDGLEPSYRLSMSYVARVVRIDTDGVPPGLPVVARRLVFGGVVATRPATEEG
jgi:hypothetical protein